MYPEVNFSFIFLTSSFLLSSSPAKCGSSGPILFLLLSFSAKGIRSFDNLANISSSISNFSTFSFTKFIKFLRPVLDDESSNSSERFSKSLIDFASFAFSGKIAGLSLIASTISIIPCPLDLAFSMASSYSPITSLAFFMASSYLPTTSGESNESNALRLSSIFANSPFRVFTSASRLSAFVPRASRSLSAFSL